MSDCFQTMGVVDEMEAGPARKKSKLSLSAKRKTQDQNPSKPISADLAPPKFNVSQSLNHVDGALCSTEVISCDDFEEPPIAPVASLYNLGNTCFMNSMLQILRYTPNFVPGVLGITEQIDALEEKLEAEENVDNGGTQVDADLKRTCQVVKNIRTMFIEMDKMEEQYRETPTSDTSRMAVRPAALLDCIRELNPMFEGNFQHDAQELLRCLLCYIEDAEGGLRKLKTVSEVKLSSHDIKDETEDHTSSEDGVDNSVKLGDIHTSVKVVDGAGDGNRDKCDVKEITILKRDDAGEVKKQLKLKGGASASKVKRKGEEEELPQERLCDPSVIIIAEDVDENECKMGDANEVILENEDKSQAKQDKSRRGKKRKRSDSVGHEELNNDGCKGNGVSTKGSLKTTAGRKIMKTDGKKNGQTIISFFKKITDKIMPSKKHNEPCSEPMDIVDETAKETKEPSQPAKSGGLMSMIPKQIRRMGMRGHVFRPSVDAVEKPINQSSTNVKSTELGAAHRDNKFTDNSDCTSSNVCKESLHRADLSKATGSKVCESRSNLVNASPSPSPNKNNITPRNSPVKSILSSPGTSLACDEILPALVGDNITGTSESLDVESTIKSVTNKYFSSLSRPELVRSSSSSPVTRSRQSRECSSPSKQSVNVTKEGDRKRSPPIPSNCPLTPGKDLEIHSPTKAEEKRMGCSFNSKSNLNVVRTLTFNEPCPDTPSKTDCKLTSSMRSLETDELHSFCPKAVKQISELQSNQELRDILTNVDTEQRTTRSGSVPNSPIKPSQATNKMTSSMQSLETDELLCFCPKAVKQISELQSNQELRDILTNVDTEQRTPRSGSVPNSPIKPAQDIDKKLKTQDVNKDGSSSSKVAQFSPLFSRVRDASSLPAINFLKRCDRLGVSPIKSSGFSHSLGDKRNMVHNTKQNLLLDLELNCSSSGTKDEQDHQTRTARLERRRNKSNINDEGTTADESESPDNQPSSPRTCRRTGVLDKDRNNNSSDETLCYIDENLQVTNKIDSMSPVSKSKIPHLHTSQQFVLKPLSVSVTKCDWMLASIQKRCDQLGVSPFRSTVSSRSLCNNSNALKYAKQCVSDTDNEQDLVPKMCRRNCLTRTYRVKRQYNKSNGSKEETTLGECESPGSKSSSLRTPRRKTNKSGGSDTNVNNSNNKEKESTRSSFKSEISGLQPPHSYMLKSLSVSVNKCDWMLGDSSPPLSQTVTCSRPSSRVMVGGKVKIRRKLSKAINVVKIKEEPLHAESSGHGEPDMFEEKPTPPLIERLFGGTMMHLTRCLECERGRERKEAFLDISVPVRQHMREDGDSSDEDAPQSNDSSCLSQLVRSASTVERLHDSNKYWCEECLHHVEAERSCHYMELPSILSLHLKRFSASAGLFGGVSKLNDKVKIPETLPCLRYKCRDGCTLPQHRYQLFGLATHSGTSILHGHYRSYVKVQPKVSPNVYNSILRYSAGSHNYEDTGELSGVTGKMKNGDGGDSLGERLHTPFSNLSSAGKVSKVEGSPWPISSDNDPSLMASVAPVLPCSTTAAMPESGTDISNQVIENKSPYVSPIPPHVSNGNDSESIQFNGRGNTPEKANCKINNTDEGSQPSSKTIENNVKKSNDNSNMSSPARSLSKSSFSSTGRNATNYFETKTTGSSESDKSCVKKFTNGKDDGHDGDISPACYWLECDDECIRVMEEHEFRSKLNEEEGALLGTPYVLFYHSPLLVGGELNS